VTIAAGNSVVWVFLALATGAVLGLAGTDLVLPAVPSLPGVLGGGVAEAQLVVAAFVAGTAVGLILFGAAPSQYRRKTIIVAALLTYSALSGAAASVRDLDLLVVLRLLQGIAASAPVAFAAPILRSLLDEHQATRALGALGSIEAIAPAVAPPVGAWLIFLWGWRAPFAVIAVSTAALAGLIVAGNTEFPATRRRETSGSYLRLLSSATFVRYCVSQACVVGGLLIFVFGAPSVIVNTMHGTVRDFVWMQVTGITCFVLAANLVAHIVRRIGAEATIWLGTLLSAGGALLIALYAAGGGNRASALVYLFIPLNLGLGIRGPPGFLRAILAGGGDDERVSSLTILAIMAVACTGTAVLGAFLKFGLVVLAGSCALVELVAVLLLLALPALPAPVNSSSS